jgi:hypothetical protein
MDEALHEQRHTGAVASEGRQQQPSQQPLPTSLLELLPTEVIIAILSAARSAADLHALICASPTVYEVFRSAKRAVFVSIVARDLGPALRDTVAARLTIPTKLDGRNETYFEASERMIQQYETLIRDDRRLARGLCVNAAVALVRANRSVQFFVDEFAASRLPELREIHPDAAGPLTATERQRLAQALIRHQVMMYIEAGTNLPRYVEVMDRFFGLLRPWEKHQLADIHLFMRKMLGHAFRYCEHPPEPRFGGLKTRSEREKEVWNIGFGGEHRYVGKEQVPTAADLVIVTEAERFYRLSRPDMALSWYFNRLHAGPLPARGGSERVAVNHWGLRDELYAREDAMPSLVFANNDDDDSTAPPFAWVDAHGGLDCQRWGVHLRREVLPAGQEDTTARQRLWMKGKLEKWRSLGLMFWDLARVELLKTRLPVYATGWLTVAPPPDGECDFPIPEEADRRPRRQRDVQHVGE